MLSFGERGYCNILHNFGNQHANKISITWLNKSNSIQITICLSILDYNTTDKRDQDTTRLKSDNIVIQPGYNAVTLHETILLS
jgi:hypothetical protein